MINSLKRAVKRSLLKRLLPHNFYFRTNGFCPCCEQQVEFLSNHSWLRDHFKCSACDSIPRNRALLRVLEKHYPRWRDLRIHESSPSAGGASARLKQGCRGYVSSQYHPTGARGTVIDGHRNEDLEAQTFDDESFDLVITQDVMEHVYDTGRVFSEIARTLKPGGAHVFCVPIINKHQPTQVWAVKDSNGQPRFLHQAEYHGNPVDSQGSPVTMHWGFDIVAHIQAACGLHTTIESLHELEFGISAEYIEVLVTHKPVR